MKFLDKDDIIFNLQDLTSLTWDENTSSTFATGGCFLKSTDETQNPKLFYKLSNYDSYRGVFGHESINELVVARLLEILNIEHVDYKLINAQIDIVGNKFNSWICCSQDYKKLGEQKIALDAYYDINKLKGESPFDFCVRMGWRRQIEQMIVADYLVANRDRHGANIEVLINNEGNKRLAPLFDNGVSLLFSCYNNPDQYDKFDVLADKPANNFILTKSLYENLKYINHSNLNFHLDKEYLDHITEGLSNVVPDLLVKQIRQMIWKRWNEYKKIQNS